MAAPFSLHRIAASVFTCAIVVVVGAVTVTEPGVVDEPHPAISPAVKTTRSGRVLFISTYVRRQGSPLSHFIEVILGCFWRASLARCHLVGNLQPREVVNPI
jgi:hypothetical protein